MQNTNLYTPIFGISRHRLTTDGKGVTTLVTFHGCTLHCKYCINPQCFGLADGIPVYTPRSLFEEIKKDDIYFRATGGGITFGGGEPCLRADFIEEFHHLCPSEWMINLETALNVNTSFIERLAPIINEWIVDIKSLKSNVFRSYTGQDIARRNECLTRLSELIPLEKIKIRIPIIPGYTTKEDADSDMETLRAFGYSHFVIVPYITKKPTHYSSLIPGILPGKAKCIIMKKIREIIAEANGIEKLTRVCTHNGDCAGTCPTCEKELADLTQIIHHRIAQNQPICL